MPHADSLSNRQRAHLLKQLAQAPEGMLTASEAKKIPAITKKELGLTAEVAELIRGELEREGKIISTKIGRSSKIVITPAGRELLGELAHLLKDSNLPFQEAYVLDVFSRATDRTISTAELELALGKKPTMKVLAARHPSVLPFRDQRYLKLNSVAAFHGLLAAHVDSGDLAVQVTGDGISYTLTPVGSERLKSLRTDYPVLPPTGGLNAKTQERIRQAQIAFILLKLSEAPHRTQTATEALAVPFPKGFKPSNATAWLVRSELANQGYLTPSWTGEVGIYTLTPAGMRHLAGLPFDAFDKLEIKGSALTELLATARSGASANLPSVTPSPTVPPTAAELEAAVMEIFHGLLRERHANIRMVPIHEVRAAVAERYGAAPASHAVFDEALHDLRRAKRVRLIAIDDRSRATKQHLESSIEASVGTLFYMEKADAAAPV